MVQVHERGDMVVPIICVSETTLTFVPQADSVLTAKSERILKWQPQSLAGMGPLLTIRPHLKTRPSNSDDVLSSLPFLFFGFSKLFPHFRVLVLVVPSALSMAGAILSIWGISHLLREVFPYHPSKVILQVYFTVLSQLSYHYLKS